MLLTIPTTPEKGEFQTYTLDVSDLIALVTEEYYQDQDNWRRDHRLPIERKAEA